MKIAICTPYLQQVEMGYATSLANMLVMTARARRDEIEIISVRSSGLPGSRTALVQRALSKGADYVLWIDSDMIFPPHSLLRLFSLDKDVVGVNYPTRSTPTEPTAMKDGNTVYSSAAKVHAATVEPVDALGFGLLLCKADVLRKLDYPMFAFLPSEDGLTFESEDYFFFRKLKEAGVQAWVDHGLSGSIGHVHVRILTQADTFAEASASARARHIGEKFYTL